MARLFGNDADNQGGNGGQSQVFQADAQKEIKLPSADFLADAEIVRD